MSGRQRGKDREEKGERDPEMAARSFVGTDGGVSADRSSRCDDGARGCGGIGRGNRTGVRGRKLCAVRVTAGHRGSLGSGCAGYIRAESGDGENHPGSVSDPGRNELHRPLRKGDGIQLRLS